MNVPVPSQSQVIASIAAMLDAAGWTVAYTCMPGRAHVGVVPIPTAGGSGQQRYPDVVSTNGTLVRLTEVEPRLSVGVIREITARFVDHCLTLREPDLYRSWSDAVRRSTGVSLPEEFDPLCELVVIRPPTSEFQTDIVFADNRNFTVELAESYSAART